MTSFKRASIQLGLLAFAAVLLTSVAFADNQTYTLTTRVKPTETPFDGKTYTQLDATDTIDATNNSAQIWLSSSATLNCAVNISGDGYGGEKTGKIRMQMGSSDVSYFNGNVNLAGNTTIASNVWQSTMGTLYFNGQITGAGAMIVAPGYLSPIHLNNTSSTPNNYQGNTQIGSSGVYNNSGVTTYAGTVILDADEQIPDVLTAGATSTGNLVLYSWSDASSRLTSTLNLNGHTETVNGLVTTDSLSVVTGTSGSKLRVGANNDTSTYSGNLQGAMQLEKIGTGTQTLSGANTYSGGTAINAGTLKLTNSSTMGTGTATVASGATVEMGTASNSTWAWGGGIINGAGTLKVTGGGTFNITRANLQVNNSGSIIADGSTLTIDISNGGDHTGADFFINNGGSVIFNTVARDQAFWFKTQTNITFDSNGGGTFDTGTRSASLVKINNVNNSATTFTTSGGATNYIQGNNGFNLNGAGLTFDVAKGSDPSGVDLEVSTYIWNTKGYGITKNGAGTMVISGDESYPNEYNGATTINAGTLKLSGYGKMGNGSGAVSIAYGATLTFASDLTQTTIANPISGAGKIVKEGTNTVNLNGGLTSYTGDMTINGGTVSVLIDGTNFNVTKLSGLGNLELRLVAKSANTQMPNLINNNFEGVITLKRANQSSSSSEKFYSNRRDFDGFTFEVTSGTTIYVEYETFKANVLLSGNGNNENYGALRLNNNMAGKITVMEDALLGINGSRTVSGNIASGAAN